jgi:hypothetical protein
MPHHWCAHTHQSSRCNWKTIQADRRCEKEKQTKQQKRSRTMSHHLCTHTHQSSHCTWTSIQARRRCKAHYIMLSPAPLSLYIFSNLTWWQGLALKTLETKTLSERERERERENFTVAAISTSTCRSRGGMSLHINWIAQGWKNQHKTHRKPTTQIHFVIEICPLAAHLCFLIF